MRYVALYVPRVIGGVVRYPVESPVSASEDEAKAIVDDQAGEYADLEEDAPDNLDKMKVEDLKALATAEEIDLGAAKSKADIVAAIRDARAAKAAAQ